MLLQDFNEIDRYLVDAKSIYKNLAEIKEIENWSLAEENKTEMQTNYIAFMSALGDVYEHFVKVLESRQIAYQGLAYKKAVANVQAKKVQIGQEYIVFAGFNALNRAEEILFRHFIEEKGARVLWDADNYYLEDPLNEAGLFLRRHFTYDFFRSGHFITNNLSEQEKKISITGAPQNMAQVATGAAILKRWILEGVDLNTTAIILCDESLLFPLLSVLPPEVEAVNVSLEYPLRQSTLYDLSEQLIDLHINKKQNSSHGAVYYKDLLRVMQNPYFNLLFGADLQTGKITKRIAENNISYFSVKTLQNVFGDHYSRVAFLFEGWNTTTEAVASLKRLSEELLAVFEKKGKASTDTEFAFEFGKLVTRLQEVCLQVNYITDLKTLRRIIQQLLAGASIPFFGEPLKGLQIMGVLETRTLDFENVILISVNENILPSGKSANTFIPFDLKRYFKLPVYQDKDAVYAYHFYRLIQCAKNIALVYNTETDAMGKGEKSRFITQLMHELPLKNTRATIEDAVALPATQEQKPIPPITILKTPALLEKLQAKANTPERSGFSPSLFNTYKDCSLRFYYNYLATIREAEEVEESVEANTFGTILHYVLEKAYTGTKGNYLSPKDFEAIYPQIEGLTEKAFREQYAESEFMYGKNYLAFHTIKLYAENLVKADEAHVKELTAANNSLKILELEYKLEYVLTLQINGEPVQVKVSGTADRIDSTADQFRIVDYKSSVSDNDKFGFEGFEILFTEKKFNKAFQLFMYAWLAWKNNLSEAAKIRTCIVPFRGNKKKEYYIEEHKAPIRFSDELLTQFEERLVEEIRQIFDPAIPFAQTEDLDKCTFCAYAKICNRQEV
jgi:RecB family exonuclease